MRAISDIKTELIQVVEMFKLHADLHNEGANDGYNPYAEKMSQLNRELTTAEHADRMAAFDLETTKARRDWFNAQKFTNPLAALKGCRAEGFEWDDLKQAVKNHKI